MLRAVAPLGSVRGHSGRGAVHLGHERARSRSERNEIVVRLLATVSVAQLSLGVCLAWPTPGELGPVEEVACTEFFAD